MDSIKFLGHVQSPLKEIKDCPLQESEKAPQAVICIAKDYLSATDGLNKGAKILVLTWLHKADRSVLMTKPRNDPKAKDTGVFATRSNDRPNPIGLHITEILSINAKGEIKVANLEVLDGTPVIDIKPVL